eukprot:TRINITY_DN66168_c0_g1_i1.p1 TRINITY_DN66168_c0_g1~~TRINITY_DN66168_c0_g1_i1.p1  ORF type:complete len:360 (-),score=77.19 TRINITY_DN66168_c0_g1_i1:99-1178(-)
MPACLGCCRCWHSLPWGPALVLAFCLAATIVGVGAKGEVFETMQALGHFKFIDLIRYGEVVFAITVAVDLLGLLVACAAASKTGAWQAGNATFRRSRTGRCLRCLGGLGTVTFVQLLVVASFVLVLLCALGTLLLWAVQESFRFFCEHGVPMQTSARQLIALLQRSCYAANLLQGLELQCEERPQHHCAARLFFSFLALVFCQVGLMAFLAAEKGHLLYIESEDEDETPDRKAFRHPEEGARLQQLAAELEEQKAECGRRQVILEDVEAKGRAREQELQAELQELRQRISEITAGPSECCAPPEAVSVSARDSVQERCGSSGDTSSAQVARREAPEQSPLVDQSGCSLFRGRLDGALPV